MQLKQSVVIFSVFLCAFILGLLHYFDDSFKPFFVAKGLCLYPIARLSSTISNWVNAYSQRMSTVNALVDRCAELDQERCFFREKYIQLQSHRWYKEDVDQVTQKINSLYALDNIRVGLILTRHFSPQEHYFFVDKGSRDGVTKDMVACSDSCLVGRVLEVFPACCKVLFITDARCSIPVLCGENKISGVLQGSNEAIAVVKYVDHLQPILENNLVITSGSGFIFPYGLGVGTVQNVDTDYIHKIVTVKPFIDYKEIKHCFLIKKEEIHFN